MRPWVALALPLLLVAGACSSDGESAPTTTGGTAAPSTPSSTSAAPAAFAGHLPDEITQPDEQGNGIVYPQPAAALPDGWTEEEYFVGGTATSFTATDTPDDGTWTAAPADEAEYRTRVIVRRPPAEDFSGTVIVEWFNVSAIEAAPDWGLVSEEIAREGHAYIGVSAQAQGVEGGDTILEVDVDPDAAADTGSDSDAEAATDSSGLVNIDPERYGTLTHPGDAYAYDIFDQVGRAAKDSPDQLLGDLEPQQVLGFGESQSAIFMSTLVNAVHPIDPVFDGFFIHSRGGTVAPLDGDFMGAAATAEDPEAAMAQGVLIRTDLDVPVFLFETETDLTLLGYVSARQPDTDLLRTWEVAGTSHVDAQTLRAVVGGPRDPSIGSLLGCTEPINIGPQKEVAQAAIHHFVDWVAGGEPPPAGERIELADGDEVAIARDEHQIALGGVRNPLVDVPVVATTGDPPGGGSIEDLADGSGSLCLLFGQTFPFDQATLVELHGSADDYLSAFQASADAAVAAGFLLQPDADALVAEAQANASLFP